MNVMGDHRPGLADYGRTLSEWHHPRLLAGVLGSALSLAVATAGCSSAGQRAGAAATGAGRAAAQVWLCRPGQVANPCAASLVATAVTGAGALRPATWARSTAASKFDCFYVYPTESLARAGNTSLDVLRDIGGQEAAWDAGTDVPGVTAR